MSKDLQTLGIARLSVTERLDLIELIWDSLPETIEPEDIPGWHLEELAARIRDADAKPQSGRPWREVLDRLGSNS
jgi:putative addiction module component (TIGR02574 family)